MADKKKPDEKEIKKHIESFGDNYEPEGQYGNDPEHMRLRKTPVNSKSNSDVRNIRIDDEFLKEIKDAAQKEGFDSYQTFIKVILRRHIDQKKKVSSE